MAVTHIILQSFYMKDHADNCLVIVLLMINLTRFHPPNVVKKKIFDSSAIEFTAYRYNLPQ